MMPMMYRIYSECIHPGNLTWPLKIGNSKRKLIFQPLFFRGYVKFRGYMLYKDVSSVLEHMHFTQMPWIVGRSILDLVGWRMSTVYI